jgi:hypothetical protein
MPLKHTGDVEPLDLSTLLLIVTGAHPKAECYDRPVAYALAARVDGLLRDRFGPGPAPLRPLVVSDVWYLNDPSLRQQPTVSIGAPGVSALTAYLADKVPSAYVIDGSLMVQMDVELTDLIACCWGVTHEATAKAVRAFEARYLDAFLDAACRQHAHG